MSDFYTKLHGTTTDRFKIGLKNERLTLTGTSVGATNVTLKDRDGNNHTANSTVFFTAYIVGRGTSNTAAYEIKGCYLEGTTTVSGYVINTYVDSSGFTEPSFSFNSSGELTVECAGVVGDTIDWTASIDFVSV